MQNRQLRIYLEGTLFAALGMVLSWIPSGIGSSFSVSLGMIPLTFYAIRRGLGPGIFAGFLWGILHFVTGSVYMLNVYQVIIEYTITYASIGLAGYYSKDILEGIRNQNGKRVNVTIAAAVLVGAVARYFWHFLGRLCFMGVQCLYIFSSHERSKHAFYCLRDYDCAADAL